MKLWKRDTKEWTVRQVEAEPWPGKDSEGETCFENTHFEKEEDAWEALQSEAEAWVLIAGRRLKNAKEDLQTAQAYCGEAALALEKVASTRPFI